MKLKTGVICDSVNMLVSVPHATTMRLYSISPGKLFMLTKNTVGLNTEPCETVNVTRNLCNHFPANNTIFSG